MLKADDFIKTQLVMMGWRFGQVYSGGHIAGQMVMNVIANRVRCGWGSWLDVIERVPSYMAENELPPLKFPSVWEGNFVKLLHAVDAAFDGSLQDMSKGALYWADLGHIERDWFKTRVVDAINPNTGLRQHPIVANMNSLSFFK